jgi:oligopeptide/dipeptide ABC transporter ATP-binding protein
VIVSLLEITDLTVVLGRKGETVVALDGLNLSMDVGEVVGVVGESGGGKSTMAKAIVGILPHGASVSGRVLFAGQDVLGMDARALRTHRGEDVAICFQSPRDALNPTRRIGGQLKDRLRAHRGLTGDEADKQALELLVSVGIRKPAQRLKAFAHELSGGMCQRVMIALSLACAPRMLLADEPTTGLDVTLTREILDLLRRSATEEGRALLIISHDLAALAAVCDRIAVLYAGRIVEVGPTNAVICRSAHPYTRALLDAVPDVAGTPTRAIRGTMPTLREPSASCPFAPRCDMATGACDATVPLEIEVGPGHWATCFFAEEEERGPAA